MHRSVRLFERRGATSIFIDAEIDADGTVVVSGQDIGEAPSAAFGGSDHEYWVHLPVAQKPALLAALRREAEARGLARSPSPMRRWALRLRRTLTRVPAPSADDLAILDLIVAQFAGSAGAYGAFGAFVEAHGIKSAGGSWV